MNAQMLRVCRVCGCTDDDCDRCIRLTGEPCHWVKPELCSCCALPGSVQIAFERQRQVTDEDYSADHDDRHVKGEIERAAKCYAKAPALRVFSTLAFTNNDGLQPPEDWPWEAEFWKPSEYRALELRKAGALYLAEHDRLIRLGKLAAAMRPICRAIACGRKIDRLVRAKG
jgi:hypothetical protein